MNVTGELTWMSTSRERYDCRLQGRILAALRDAGGTVVDMSGGSVLTTTPDALNADNTITVQTADMATLERCRVAVEQVAGRSTTLQPAGQR